jgi:hypothetical protein
MATFSEALDVMKNNGIVQLPDGSTYCLCSSTELLTDLVSTEVADLIGALSGVIQPVFFKGDSKNKIAQFGWMPTINDLLRDDWILPQ